VKSLIVLPFITFLLLAETTTFTWTKNDPLEQVDKYRIYYKDETDGEFYQVFADLGDVDRYSFDSSRLTPGHKYTFVITAISSAHNIESEYSKTVSYTALATLPPPSPEDPPPPPAVYPLPFVPPPTTPYEDRILSRGANPPFLSGIYKKNVSAISATIVWNSDPAVDNATVSYGIASCEENIESVSHGDYLNHHVVLLPNLLPETPYYFCVSNVTAEMDSAISYESNFNTFTTLKKEAVPRFLESDIQVVTDENGEKFLEWKAKTNIPTDMRLALPTPYSVMPFDKSDGGIGLYHYGRTPLLKETKTKYVFAAKAPNDRINTGELLFTDATRSSGSFFPANKTPIARALIITANGKEVRRINYDATGKLINVIGADPLILAPNAKVVVRVNGAIDPETAQPPVEYVFKFGNKNIPTTNAALVVPAEICVEGKAFEVKVELQDIKGGSSEFPIATLGFSDKSYLTEMSEIEYIVEEDGSVREKNNLTKTFDLNMPEGKVVKSINWIFPDRRVVSEDYPLTHTFDDFFRGKTVPVKAIIRDQEGGLSIAQMEIDIPEAEQLVLQYFDATAASSALVKPCTQSDGLANTGLYDFMDDYIDFMKSAPKDKEGKIIINTDFLDRVGIRYFDINKSSSPPSPDIRFVSAHNLRLLPSGKLWDVVANKELDPLTILPKLASKQARDLAHSVARKKHSIKVPQSSEEEFQEEVENITKPPKKESPGARYKKLRPIQHR